MVKKISKIFICSKCDAQFPKWNGRCLECGAWGTIVEEISDAKASGKKAMGKIAGATLINLGDIDDIETNKRMEVGVAEFDRVLGGGIVPGSLILLSGEPGIGKSTIIAQIADAIAKNKKNGDVIYASGEESAAQVKNRLLRLKCDIDNIKFISETNVEKIINATRKEHPGLLIIDSIQTVYSSIVESEAGGVSQIRSSAVAFMELAKQDNIATVLIGHITKDGSLAGPKSLEHIVDTVLYLESEKGGHYRMLRTTKNRFGCTNELGIFEMTSTGLMEVENPSSCFLDAGLSNSPGSVISCVIEGTRPFLVEIQALVSKTVFGYPQRKTSGFDMNRLQVLTAVLTKRAGINLTNQDVILNIVGGVKISDTALDLPVCAAIISSFLNKPINRKTITLGEVGLGGEVRNVSRIKERIQEVEKLGFDKLILAPTKDKLTGIDIEIVESLEKLVRVLR